MDGMKGTEESLRLTLPCRVDPTLPYPTLSYLTLPFLSLSYPTLYFEQIYIPTLALLCFTYSACSLARSYHIIYAVLFYSILFYSIIHYTTLHYTRRTSDEDQAFIPRFGSVGGCVRASTQNYPSHIWDERQVDLDRLVGARECMFRQQ